MELLGGIVRFFQQEGGAFMYPILYRLSRWCVCNRRRTLGIPDDVRRFQSHVVEENRAISEGRQLPGSSCGNRKSKAAIASILTYGLYRVKVGAPS